MEDDFEDCNLQNEGIVEHCEPIQHDFDYRAGIAERQRIINMFYK